MLVHKYSNIVFKNERIVIVELSKNEKIRASELKFYLKKPNFKNNVNIKGFLGTNGDTIPIIYKTEDDFDTVIKKLTSQSKISDEISNYKHEGFCDGELVYKYLDEKKLKNINPSENFFNELLYFEEVMKLGVFENLETIYLTNEDPAVYDKINTPKLKTICVDSRQLHLLNDFERTDVNIVLYNIKCSDPDEHVKKTLNNLKFYPKNIFGYDTTFLPDDNEICKFFISYDNSNVFPDHQRITIKQYVQQTKKNKIIFEKSIRLNIYDILLLSNFNCTFKSKVTIIKDDFLPEYHYIINDFIKKNKGMKYSYELETGSTSQLYLDNVPERTRKRRLFDDICFVKCNKLTINEIMVNNFIVESGVILTDDSNVNVNSLCNFLESFKNLFLGDILIDKSLTLKLSSVIKITKDKNLIKKLKIV